MVGLLPVFAGVEIDSDLWERLPNFRKRIGWFIEHTPRLGGYVKHFLKDDRPVFVGLLGLDRLKRVLARMLDEAEFLSPYGLRSLSRYHRDHPLAFSLDGVDVRLDYEPAESTTPLFGGNSNWRGPVWFPLNFLALESLRHLHRCLGGEFTVELPTGSGVEANLDEAADEIARRLVRLFLPDAEGRRPVHGQSALFRKPEWGERPLFYEYYNAETGQGLGASHQTGWSALIATIIARRGRR